jgi:hypothetical protein
MSLFLTLKNAIFGSAENRPPPATPTTPPPASTPAAPGSRAGIQVDVESILNAKAAKKTEKLNWQSSIVDLMKLVDLDPSLENRKALAGELGYTGDTKDTASMNVWLHREVMQQLAAAGGKVPQSLHH